jgi:hypothetical protein
LRFGAALGFAGVLLAPNLPAQDDPPPVIDPEPPQTFAVREYRIIGSRTLPRDLVDKAVYGHLGPGRTPEDVENARAALEKAYHAEGFQTVAVSVPPQGTGSGVIVLQVTEATIGRLRVRGSRFFDIEKIKKMAPALAEGTVPNFNDVQRDIIALNQTADLQVTPSLAPEDIPAKRQISSARKRQEKPRHEPPHLEGANHKNIKKVNKYTRRLMVCNKKLPLWYSFIATKKQSNSLGLPIKNGGRGNRALHGCGNYASPISERRASAMRSAWRSITSCPRPSMRRRIFGSVPE